MSCGSSGGAPRVVPDGGLVMAVAGTRDRIDLGLEIMLQQMVGTVALMMNAFSELPDLRSLARAPLDDVLKAWEG